MVRVLRQRRAQPGGEGGAAVALVEADVQHGAGGGGHQVGHAVADIDAGDLQGRWLEPLAAGVDRRRGQRGERAHQAVDRVVGAVRVGDVALRAVHGDRHVDAAAPADFHHVAEFHRTGRLADQAEVRDLAVLLHPRQDAHGAVGGDAFLVAGDQQADRAARRAGFEVLRGRGDERGDGALHVAGAAAVQDAVAHFRGERVAAPAAARRRAPRRCGRRSRNAGCRCRCGRTGSRSRRSAGG